MPYQISTIAVLGSVALILAACASPAERPGAHTAISTDQFSKTVDIEGPLMVENRFFGVSKFYNLVTRVDKQTHAYLQMVSVEVSYDNDPFNFQFAADDTAQELQLFRITRSSRACRDCEREESFNVVIPDAALRSHAATGYPIKVSSRAGYYIILTISPAMIATQFAGLDEFLKTGAIGLR